MYTGFYNRLLLFIPDERVSIGHPANSEVEHSIDPGTHLKDAVADLKRIRDSAHTAGPVQLKRF
jgi:hypothetical protein